MTREEFGDFVDDVIQRARGSIICAPAEQTVAEAREAVLAAFDQAVGEARREGLAEENVACEAIARQHAAEAKRRELSGGATGERIATEIGARRPRRAGEVLAENP